MVDLLVPIVAGLSALHDVGIVHGDLRPSSLFVPASNERPQSAKLLDFGITRAFGGDRLVRTSGTRGPWRGNPLYFSPEAVRGDELSPAADQYSLGVVMYEAVAGVNPFAADSMLEAVRRVTSGEYLPFRQQAPSASALLARIVERAMQVDARYRYPDIRALGRDLLRLASEPTRVTWALSFPNSDLNDHLVEHATVVELSPITLPPGPRAATAPRLRNTLHELLGEPPWRDARAFEWTTALALLVGAVSFALALAILLR
jgi:serine/threonine-protein kinase